MGCQMVFFPNAKINIGLYITGKREDGFHSLETIFYPVKWCDILEFVEPDKEDKRITFSSSGIAIPGRGEDNICVNAYNLLAEDYNLPGLAVHLHKIIPIGAGLGGGSADGAFMLSSLNEYFKLNISNTQLKAYAAQLGSDCAFFIDNKPSFASGRGEVLEPVDFSLEGYYLILVVPSIHVSTVEAYKGIVTASSTFDLRQINKLSVKEWKGNIINQFEESIFAKYAAIKEIKDELYRLGAAYASMSGSGSAVYGIFTQQQNIASQFEDCTIWQGELNF